MSIRKSFKRFFMSKTLLIPKTKEDNIDVKAWLDFIIDNRYNDSHKDVQTLILDFSLVEYIYTVQLVSLACLIEEYYDKGIKIDFTNCIDSVATPYLNEIKFFEYWTDNFDRTQYTKVKNTNCICLWKLHHSMIDSFVKHFQDFAEKQWKKGKDFSGLNVSLGELLNNIQDHSESKVSGYSIIQYHPRHQQLRISVCDFGIGIPASVCRFMDGKRVTLTNEQAIIKAFEPLFTVGSQKHNKGLGLGNLNDNVYELNGNLDIYTNDVILKVQNKEFKTSCIDKNIHGTIVDVLIDTNLLEDIDEEKVNFELF